MKFNMQMLNGSKYPEKYIGLVIIKKNITIPLFPTYYMPQNPQHTISQISIEYYNQFRVWRTEVLKYLQLKTDLGKKLEV